jgi:hypothetical protein
MCHLTICVKFSSRSDTSCRLSFRRLRYIMALYLRRINLSYVRTRPDDLGGRDMACFLRAISILRSDTSWRFRRQKCGRWWGSALISTPAPDPRVRKCPTASLRRNAWTFRWRSLDDDKWLNQIIMISLVLCSTACHQSKYHMILLTISIL